MFRGIWQNHFLPVEPNDIPSCFSRVRLFVTPWTAACQAPLPMEFSRQEYWNGLSCPPPGDFPTPGIEPTSLMSPALAGGFFTSGATWKVCIFYS